MSDLSALTHRQWSLNVLVELLRGPDKKAGALARRLDVSRQTLLATLKALSVQGLIEGSLDVKAAVSALLTRPPKGEE